ncbi:MAG: hypothetical protein V4692_14525 [Bdellovibrionota bacterium]
MKTLFVSLSSLIALTFTVSANAVGIPAKDLLLPCSGEVMITSVENTGVRSGWSDRAGRYHPPHGYASLKVSFEKLDDGCHKLQSKLKVDFATLKMTKYSSYTTTNKAEIATLANAEVGTKAKFEAVQTFSYQDSNGFLPFFPLTHQESVQIKSSLYLSQAYVHVDSKLAYGIDLDENGKVELTDLLFDYLDAKHVKGVADSTVHYLLFKNVPTWQNHFRTFLAKLLKVYDVVENKLQPEGIWQNQEAGSMGSQINKLSYSYPGNYDLKYAEYVASHPSAVVYASEWSDGNSCPNMTVIDLENAMALVETKFANGEVSEMAKARWKKAFEVMAFPSNSANGGCLSDLTSGAVKALAKELLEKYFPASTN